METIKNAIWGSSDKQAETEPVSGQTGAGTVDQPYDAGNAPGVEGSNEGITDGSTGGTTENFFGRDRGGPEPNNLGPHQTSLANKLDPRVDSDGDGKPRSGPNDFEHAGVNTSSTISSSGIGSGTAGRVGGDAFGTDTLSGARTDDTTSSSTGLPQAGSSHREQTSTLTGDTSDFTSAAGTQATGGTVGTQQSHDKTGVTGTHASGTTYNDTEGSNANAPSTSEVGQSRGPIGGFGAAEPSVSAQPASGTGLSSDIQGGEKPLQDPSDTSGETLDRRGSLVEGSEGGAGPLNAKERGTGEKYVKSSGMAADGGDFDASAPGAAKEANRLLEEKGVDRSSGSNTGEVHRAPGETEKEKVSLGQKLKEKLHIGSHKDKS